MRAQTARFLHQELNVCDNVNEHLLGNVYVKYAIEDDAEKALKALQGRYYAGLCSLHLFELTTTLMPDRIEAPRFLAGWHAFISLCICCAFAVNLSRNAPALRRTFHKSSRRILPAMYISIFRTYFSPRHMFIFGLVS